MRFFLPFFIVLFFISFILNDSNAELPSKELPVVISVLNNATSDSATIMGFNDAACNGTPAIGNITGVSEILPDSNFTLILSGNFASYTGLTFQWQSSLSGSNNFTNIFGATTANLTTSENVNKEYRCIVTCINSGISISSNIFSVICSNNGGNLFRVKFNNKNLNGSINGIHFVTPAKGFAAFSNAVGYTQDSGHTFTFRNITIGNTNFNGYSVNLTFGFMPNGVYAFSQDSLFTYGHFGAEPSILFSANQGISWKVVYHQPFETFPDIENTIFDMKFWDGVTGIATTETSVLLTTDKGQSWSVRFDNGGSSKLSKISLSTADGGFVISGKILYQAFEKGDGWSERNINIIPVDPYLNFSSISFIDGLTGYIGSDQSGTIYKTINGGVSWTKANNGSLYQYEAPTDIHFTDENTGFICTSDSYNVLKTSNGGVSWEVCKKNAADTLLSYGMNRLFFLNNQTAWACGNGEYLMMTTTGGNPTNPSALFKIDTTNLSATGKVDLINLSKKFYQCKWYKNGVLISTLFNTSFTRDIYRENDTIALVVFNGIDKDSLVQYINYPPFTQTPIINSFSPASGSPHSIINITGLGFFKATGVSFGGVPALSFVVNSNFSISAIVAGGSSGDIVVTTPYATASISGFSFILPSPPTINSFSPSGGKVGTVVTINGNNFNPTASENIVLFGKIKSTILSATASQIICIAPAGCSLNPISIIDKSTRLIGQSFKPFNITFLSDGIVNGTSFSNTLNITTKSVFDSSITQTLFVAACDVDGDGKNDLITLEGSFSVGYYLHSFRNNSTIGNISFEQKKLFGELDSKYMLSLNDIDGDGKLDLICSNYDVKGKGFLDIYKNISTNGNIAFASPIQFPFPVTPWRFAIEDLDGDGRPDITTMIGTAPYITVFRNISIDGNISFAPQLTIGLAYNPIGIAFANLDNDKKPELVVMKNITSLLTVFKNTSVLENISFESKIDIVAGNTSSISALDMDNDNKLDIVLFDPSFSVVRNNTTVQGLAFDAPKTFSPIANVYGIGNFDGNDLPDAVSASNSIYFCRNTGGYGFVNYTSSSFLNGVDPSIVSSADFDGDGKQDILFVNTYNGLSFYRNTIKDISEDTLCPSNGTRITMQSNLNGTVYHWQVNKGSGFSSINTDYWDDHYSNFLGNILEIYNAPSSWYGYKYRCSVDSNYSDTFTLHFANKWTGSADNKWSNANNWSCGVTPDEFTDVIINAGAIVIDENAICRSLVVKPQASVTINPTIKLTISH